MKICSHSNTLSAFPSLAMSKIQLATCSKQEIQNGTDKPQKSLRKSEENIMLDKGA